MQSFFLSYFIIILICTFTPVLGDFSKSIYHQKTAFIFFPHFHFTFYSCPIFDALSISSERPYLSNDPFGEFLKQFLNIC